MFGSVKNFKRKFNTQGIGLGLVISKMIVQKFGGRIGFKSKYMLGSEFMFDFEIDDNRTIRHQSDSEIRLIKLDLPKVQNIITKRENTL